MALNAFKADLAYKDLSELKSIVQKSLPSDDKLKNAKICNSLLKLYDEGKKLCALGEEEKAYILLMRFVDSSMKLKTLTRASKSEREFVESMITGQVLKTSIELLEKLQASLTERYKERSLSQVKSALSKVKLDEADAAADSAKIVLVPTPKAELQDSTKKFMTPVELVKFVENALTTPPTTTTTTTVVKRFLIIDIRPQDEFDSSHIDLSLFLSKFKQSTLELVCINIPGELIRPVSWEIEKNLETSGNSSAAATEAFKTRTSFDQLILIDKQTSSKSLVADSRMAIFKRALHDFESEKRLKSEPVILDGGWEQWVDFYPGCCKRSATASLKKSSVQEATSKSSSGGEVKKSSANFYPDADLLSQRMDNIRSKPAAAQEPKSAVEAPKPVTSVPAAPPQVSIKTEPLSFEKPTIPKVEPSKSSSQPAPTVDRSKKPLDLSNKTTSRSRDDSSEIKQPEPASSGKSEEIDVPAEQKEPKASLGPKPEVANARPQETTADTAANMKQPSALFNSSSDFINYKPPSGQAASRSFKIDFNRNLVDTVYKPNGFQAPSSNQEKVLTKVLDNQTGLFSYFEQPTQQQPTPTRTTSQQVPPVAPTPPPQPQPQAERKEPSEPTRESFKAKLNGVGEIKQAAGGKFESSNLKRTISTPNIASLVDNDDDDDEEAAVNSFKKTLKPTTDADEGVKSVSNLGGRTIPPVNVDASASAKLLLPSVDRNRKPAVGSGETSLSLSQVLSQANMNKSNNALSAMATKDLQPAYSNDVRPGLTGLRNLGNTCFMNSIIQCLSNTRLLLEYFLTSTYSKDLNRSNKLGFGGQIADEFAVIVQSLWRGHFKTISPRRFKYLIGQFNEQFITNEQQDSQELLLFLLDGLHEDLNKASRRPPPIKQDDLDKMADLEASVASWKIHVAMNNSIVVDLFQGQFKSTVTCLTCGKESVKFDAFMYLTLPIPSSRCTIYDCVELFLQPEKMSGQSKWKCPKCNQLREASQKFDIWKLPQILIVHLKRFKYHGVWRDKLTTFVDYPLENLDMDKYLYKNSPFTNANNSNRPTSNNNNSYFLYGISNHSGTMDGGHYTSMCRHPTFNSWFKYDDADVWPVSDASSLKSPTSYILFYSRY